MKTQHASDASKRDGNATEQYFAAEPSSEDVRRRMKVTLRGQDAVVEVSNGVFSGSRLDLGTSVLLREVPEPPEMGRCWIWAADGDPCRLRWRSPRPRPTSGPWT